MASLTFFFCGTGSNSFDFSNTNYHKGELISTLARNHAGQEFVDWAIVDGPGSGNIQEAEKWVKSGNYWEKKGKLAGMGWEENVKHAVAVVLGISNIDRQEHTKKEKKLLRKMGVGVETKTVPGRLWGTREVKEEIPLHVRISPQALQQKKVEIMSKSKPLSCINAIGWSRGAVTCHMFANALAELPELSHIPVNIFACDPVPGSGGFKEHRITIQKNVHNYVAIYAVDERSRGFSPILPTIPETTTSFITTIPGRHATLVGNASVDGDSGFNDLFGPGIVTRDLAEKCLTKWGTSLNKKLNLSNLQIIEYYEDMLRKKEKYNIMHDKSYTYFTQKGSRSVGHSDGTFSDLNTISLLQPDNLYVNSHHRALAWRRDLKVLK